ncbi:efflux RND transporter periplasmic adaptor subunit [Spartinivicinus poritis]|uniref:Efflux RND transporter periplasmic adaptor subunit n=1 Tax=Spartinivicinus poritis TaxID=2994640 RepID=A0ABT5U6W8_9GAMM|nr:efflux RND transporter periplasmic adaptor subunit [Spartinivicinus sp. A2-2]MDE1462113.1 efflux RND transporter periplasmic adaptor subunit [Spartinivicinus sp. A2-2]
MTKKARRLAVVGVFMSFVLAIAGWNALDWFKPEPIEYITAPVEKRDIEETVLATGVLEGAKQVAVGAQVTGQLKSMKVSVGDRVTKGQLLAEIDPVLPRNNLKRAMAELKNIRASRRASEAMLRYNELNFKRQREMSAENAASVADMENARAQMEKERANIEALDAQIVKAEIQVETEKANLGFTKIVAPMDGVVIATKFEEGQTLVSSQEAPTLLVLAKLDTMKVKAQISEADVTRVKPGLEASFTVLGNQDRLYKGMLRTIKLAPDKVFDKDSGSDSNKAVYYSGLLEVPNADHSLRVAMTAQVSIIINRQPQVLSIPISALNPDQKISGSQHKVRVLVNGQPEDRTIKTGIRDNVYVQVLSGLNSGDDVILSDSLSVSAEGETAVVIGG